MRYGAGLRWFLTAAVVVTGLASVARAEEEGPGRGVARISVINGDVSIRRGDSGDWVAAAVNAPAVVGDAISTGPGARAEVQFDYANVIRLGSDTEVRLSELEYRRYQVQVARGTVVFRVLRNSDADVDVSTPAVSIRPQKKGAYRVSVRDDGEVEITARSGEVEIYTPRGVERLHSGQTMLARGTASDPEFQMTNAVPHDEFDRWNEDRDRYLERSASYRYVHPSVYGAEDLDPYGRWVYDAPYGWVWVPSAGPGWAPYSRGRWVWEDWYGWTWVSYDPWGWAPYHYGRWYHSRWGWCWYPGPARVSYWSPALVAFFGFGGGGGVHVGFGFGRVGWVPLAPHEPYYPWYGRGYYGGYRGGYVDRSVNITNVNIVNVYRNARVQNGISGMEAGNFGRGNHQIVRVSNDEIHQAGLVRGQLPVAPERASLRFADGDARHAPRTASDARFFSRRQAAPVERIPFAEQQRSFQRTAGDNAAHGPARGGDVRRASENAAPAVGAQPGSVDRTNGWRRAGERAPNSTGTEQLRGNTPAVNATPNRSGDGGWRRFGEMRRNEPAARAPEGGTAPRTTEGATTPRANEPAKRNQPAGNDNWRRFGEGSSRPEVQRRDAPAQNRETPAQPRRETPAQRQEAPAKTVEPGGGRVNRPAEQQNRQDNSASGRSWQHFGDPSRNSFVNEAAPRAPRSESPAYTRPSRQESLPIGNPVVRERSAPRMESAPRVERAPRMENAPRAESAPRSEARGGGGGGTSRSDGGGRGGRNK